MRKRISANQPAKDKTEQFSTKQKILKERLHEAWILICKAYNIDPENPPKMEKRMFFAGTHKDHQKHIADLEKNIKKNEHTGI